MKKIMLFIVFISSSAFCQVQENSTEDIDEYFGYWILSDKGNASAILPDSCVLAIRGVRNKTHRYIANFFTIRLNSLGKSKSFTSTDIGLFWKVNFDGKTTDTVVVNQISPTSLILTINDTENYYFVKLDFKKTSKSAPKSLSIQKWETLHNIWLDEKTIHYSYDSLGNTTKSIEIFFTKDTVEVKRVISTYNYNSDYLLMSKFETQYDSLTDNLINDYRHTYQYDSTLKPVQVIIDIGDSTGNSWNKSTKINYYYNKLGMRTSMILQVWNDSIYNWTNHSKENYKFNFWKQGLLSVKKVWHSESNNWIDKQKLTKVSYKYDALGELATKLFWVRSNDKWIYDYRYIYNYENRKWLMDKPSRDVTRKRKKFVQFSKTHSKSQHTLGKHIVSDIRSGGRFLH